MNSSRLRSLVCVGMLIMCVALAACVTRPTLVDHAFGFDLREDSPGIKLLAYRYGNSRAPGARLTEHEMRAGTVRVATNINGPMLRGDTLYVRWQVQSTGQIYEDTVDLRKCLPSNITEHRIHFEIKGTQLIVYLISPEKRHAGWPESPLRKYSDLKVFTIYPDQTNPLRCNSVK